MGDAFTALAPASTLKSEKRMFPVRDEGNDSESPEDDYDNGNIKSFLNASSNKGENFFLKRKMKREIQCWMTLNCELMMTMMLAKKFQANLLELQTKHFQNNYHLIQLRIRSHHTKRPNKL